MYSPNLPWFYDQLFKHLMARITKHDFKDNTFDCLIGEVAAYAAAVLKVSVSIPLSDQIFVWSINICYGMWVFSVYKNGIYIYLCQWSSTCNISSAYLETRWYCVLDVKIKWKITNHNVKNELNKHNATTMSKLNKSNKISRTIKQTQCQEKFSTLA